MGLPPANRRVVGWLFQLRLAFQFFVWAFLGGIIIMLYGRVMEKGSFFFFVGTQNLKALAKPSDVGRLPAFAWTRQTECCGSFTCFRWDPPNRVMWVVCLLSLGPAKPSDVGRLSGFFAPAKPSVVGRLPAFAWARQNRVMWA